MLLQGVLQHLRQGFLRRVVLLQTVLLQAALQPIVLKQAVLRFVLLRFTPLSGALQRQTPRQVALRQRALQRLTMGLSACLLLACTSSKVTESHVDKALLNRDLDGVLVVAITKMQASRKDFEEAFAKAISKRGVRAVASIELVPAHDPSADAILAAAAKAQLDTILVTRYIGEEREEVYHPGRIYYGVAPIYGPGYYGGFDSYYGHAYEVAYQQPVWSANVTHHLVSDLYIGATQEHMWQAVSETVQSSADTRTRNAAISALIGDLKAQGLLP